MNNDHALLLALARCDKIAGAAFDAADLTTVARVLARIDHIVARAVEESPCSRARLRELWLKKLLEVAEARAALAQEHRPPPRRR